MLLSDLYLKVTYVVLLIALLLSLTACGSFYEENQEPTPVENTTTENSEETQVAAEPAIMETEPIVTTVPTVTESAHKYSSATFAPTCTEDGYTISTCSLCGDNNRKSGGKATGHNWGEWKIIKKATTEEGNKQRICKNCEKLDSCKIDKLQKVSEPTYEKFTKSIGKYNAHNLAYKDWKGDTEQAAFIEVYTVEKSDKALENLAKEFEKVYGFSPDLDNKYHAISSCKLVGVYKVDGYKEPQMVYHYTITDKTYIYITNDMYKVYVQKCDDGSVWVGYCLYGTMVLLMQSEEKLKSKHWMKKCILPLRDLLG